MWEQLEHLGEDTVGISTCQIPQQSWLHNWYYDEMGHFVIEKNLELARDGL